MKRLLLVTAMLLCSLSHAQIGTEADATLAGLRDAGLDTGPADRFSMQATVHDGLLFGLAGTSDASDEAFQKIALAAAHATGFGESLVQPVVDFLQANIESLSGAGPVRVPIEGNYVLLLEAEAGPAGSTTLEWAVELFEIDERSFPPARHFLGSETARIVIREFGDFQCPHCRTFALEVLPMLEQELLARGDVRIEFHHLPLVTLHANAVPAAEAVECVAAANGPDSFWTFGHTVFERMQAWQALPDTSSYFVRLAEEAGLETDGVAACLSERTQLAHVQESQQVATRTLGLSGTPSVFVNGYKVSTWNSLESYLQLIDMIEARGRAP